MFTRGYPQNEIVYYQTWAQKWVIFGPQGLNNNHLYAEGSNVFRMVKTIKSLTPKIDRLKLDGWIKKTTFLFFPNNSKQKKIHTNIQQLDPDVFCTPLAANFWLLG